MTLVANTPIRTAAIAALLGSGCAHAEGAGKPADPLAAASPAHLAPEPPPVVQLVPVPEPLPLPGQLMPLGTGAAAKETGAPPARIADANAAARVEPARAGYVNAIQRFAYAEGALYQVYTTVGRVTDIALEPGETLVGPGPVAAGDTARWLIGDTTSGAGPSARVHIMVKPTAPGLATNMVINTDRRTYHLELRATPATYMASVSWRYPADELIALRRAAVQAQAAQPAASGLDLDALDFGYRIEGDAPWRPSRAFDDGRQVVIEFPPIVATGEMPPLFVLGADSRSVELVNYRVRGHRMIVDRLFAAAELRLGGKRQQRVRITRERPR
jgi:type IV secretion system protein VirB9